MKDKIFIFILASLLVAVIGFSIFGCFQAGKSESKGRATLKITILGSSTEKTYEVENITAIKLLQKDNEVNLTFSKYGAFVQCINKICSTNDYYWMYYADNELAAVGADAYAVKDNDTIEFKYSKIEYQIQ